jgi:hypothetical protein
VQAAECWLREKTGIVGVNELDLIDVRRERDARDSSGPDSGDSSSLPAETVTALFTGPGDRRWAVRVRGRRVDTWRPLTCHSTPSLPYAYDLLDIGETTA